MNTDPEPDQDAPAAGTVSDSTTLYRYGTRLQLKPAPDDSPADPGPRSGVRAVVDDDRATHSYFVFADGQLLHVHPGDTAGEVVASLPSIGEVAHGVGDGRSDGEKLELRMYSHGPWVCVTERFGLHAALVDTATGGVREMQREDYHADVCSYSIGFLERDGRTFLVAQTAWNRLDVFDVETWQCLTEREVEHPDKNYLDYFHSLLHVSPDSRHFLSNGWVWSPLDMVMAYSTKTFLQGWDPTGVPFRGSGYNWDRPCTFVDDETFVVAVDNDGLDEPPRIGEQTSTDRPYHQLARVKLPHFPQGQIEDVSYVECDAFRPNAYGEVKGELHYDPVTARLVALTADGACAVSLTGEILARLPDVTTSQPSHGDLGSRYSGTSNWAYSDTHRLFYHWDDATGIQEQAFPG
ncbi:MAG: hypothetical protein FWH11_13580 [Micrococcales bacterium]|nr:hypothetical protein [Micrococcales bacterium]